MYQYQYQGNIEEIDVSSTKEEAEKLLREYRLAFGPNSNVWVEARQKGKKR